MSIKIAAKKKAPSFLRYLACRVEPGMFRNELLVYVDGISRDGQNVKIQMLADQEEVKYLSGNPRRNNPVDGWLVVTLAREKDDLSEVVLPQPAQPVGECLLVKSDKLKKEVGR